jgi:hypothetical protein
MQRYLRATAYPVRLRTMTPGPPGASRNATRPARLGVYAELLASFAILFALRVAAQALQRWAPQPLLPPFEEFQGSTIPYGILLCSQLVILTAMAYYTFRLRSGTLTANHRAGILLAWLGGLYMTVSVGRVAIGLAVSDAGAWFSAWIPAALHVILAAFVVTLAYYHVVESPPR